MSIIEVEGVTEKAMFALRCCSCRLAIDSVGWAGTLRDRLAQADRMKRVV